VAREQKTGALATSDWVIAEFSAALSKKQRTGEIYAAYRAYALAEFHRTTLPALTGLEVRSTSYHTAARYADNFALGLRAGDALHLAIASGYGAALHTLDKRLAAAGPPLGVRTVLL
jgi:hypothetical protein